MRRVLRMALPAMFAVAMIGAALPAAAQKAPRETPTGTSNLKHTANLPRTTEFTQSDLAFRGNIAFAGTYDGFRIINISNPNKPRLITHFECAGLQGDVSVHGDLLFRSVDQPLSGPTCDATPVDAATPGMFEGIQVFDISDLRNPELVATIQTDCGSHTHTLYPQGDTVYIYVSSYPLTPVNWGPDCVRLEDGGGHGYISIIELDVNNPAGANVTRYFLDEGTALAEFDLSILGAPIQSSFVACHDISVFVELQLAAGACMSEAQLWDISDPLNPEFLWRFDHPIVDPGKVDLWHSAAFSWDGKVVAFGDESGGGALPRCEDPEDLQGRIWFLDVESGELLANYKIPRSESGICTMHNFNFLPQKHGQYTLVSSAYTGGTTVVDVNALIAGASEEEAEIAWAKPQGANTWSSYWYNGRVYANDILRGLDVFILRSGARATAQRLKVMNPQTQVEVIT